MTMNGNSFYEVLSYYHDYNNLDYPIDDDGFMRLCVCLSHLKACLRRDGYQIIDKDEFETLMVYI